MNGQGYHGRRAAMRPPTGGPVSWLLSLPARLHLRWLVIGLLIALAVWLYGRVMLTAPPMPPAEAPQTGTATSSPPPESP